jgi:hypothetical protein
MYVEEESSCLCRILMAILGCLNLRPLKLHFYSASQTNNTTVRRRRLGCWAAGRPPFLSAP